MRPTILLPAAVFTAVLALAAIAAIAGPVRMGEPIIPFDELRPAPAQPADPEEMPTEDPGTDDISEQLGRLGVGILVLGGIGAMVALIALYTLVSLLLAGRDPTHPLRLGDAADGVDLDVGAALQGEAERSSHVLESTPPGEAGNAVVACWVELERVAEDAGQPRARAQTPTEFTARLLVDLSGDRRAVENLLGLYHLARFSSAPLPDDAAEVAATSLRALSRALAANP